MKFLLIIILITNQLCFSELKFEKPYFYPEIEDQELNEISGIVKSNQHDIFWVHNDSGGEPIIYGVNLEGKLITKLVLENTKNQDWEDISYGYFDNQFNILIGEIGDNNLVYKTKKINIITEPTSLNDEILINQIKTIYFQTDTISDFETLIFHPISKSIYLVTKGLVNEKVYEIKYPYNFMDTLKLNSIGELTLTNPDKGNLNRITGGEISFDANYLVLKDYTSVYIYKINQNIEFIFQNDPVVLENYLQLNEPQGEAICWGNKNYDIFTIGEEIFNIPCKFQYFKEISINNIKVKESILDIKNKNFELYDLNGKKLNKKEIHKFENQKIILLDLINKKSYLVLLEA